MDEKVIREKFNSAKSKVDTARAEFTDARKSFIRMDLVKTLAASVRTVGPKLSTETELDWGNRIAEAIEKSGYKLSKRGAWGR